MNQSTGIKILVVDDEDSIRDIIKQVLDEDGHTVTTASSGEAALEILVESPVQLVITDIRMEGIDGMELLAKIKATNPETEVVIITSHASLDSSITALRKGAFDYLLKPFENLDVISNMVNKVAKKLQEEEERQNAVDTLKTLSEDVLNRLHAAAILVDSEGTPLLTNNNAQTLLASDSGLCIEDGKLTTQIANKRGELRDMLQQVSQQQETVAGELAIMKIPRNPPQMPLSLLISPVQNRLNEADGRSSQPTALVLITDDNQKVELSVEVLNLLYGLTPAESRLTIALVDGLELDQIAEKFCVSQNTLRAQLRSVFRKTGVRRQSELVKLILTGLAKYSS